MTPEKELKLKYFEMQVPRMSEQQAKEFLVKLYKHCLTQEAVARDLLKQKLIGDMVTRLPDGPEL